eukprot:GILK01010508.1.p1 GENE.GILK01010508.1~~GILK01010508.1.p1  ORF type:complete len:726 (-),score=156.19 GILK01010508.1:84-2261(-)
MDFSLYQDDPSLDLGHILSGNKGHEASDYVEYRVYVDEVSKADGNQVESLLQASATAFQSYLAKYTKNYLWHKDPFQLTVHMGKNKKPANKYAPHRPNEDTEPHLYGYTRVGENIEDEWFIVFLLKDLSREFHNITVSLEDADGQFLLIEAAMFLPRWINPDTSVNRVFLRGGALHLLPKRITTGGTGVEQISLHQALDFLRSPTEATAASKEIQDAIMERMNGYPQEAIAASSHVVRCLLPLKAVHALAVDPPLVSAAAEAFYLRDPVALRAAARLQVMDPTEGCHMTMVRFNRCQYAQLLSQTYHPPKRFPPAPPSTHPDWKAVSLGAKLTVGMELLYLQKHKQGAHIETVVDESNPDFLKYVDTLSKMGYFQGNIPGSKEYNLKRTEALQQFRNYCSTNSDGELQIAHPSDRLKRALQHPYQPSDYTNRPLRADDSEEWMEMTESDVDRLIQARAFDSTPTEPTPATQTQTQPGKQTTAQTKKEAKTQTQTVTSLNEEVSKTETGGTKDKLREKKSVSDDAQLDEDMKDIVEKMNQFVKQMSSHEGVEIDPSRLSRKEGASFLPVDLDADKLMKLLRPSLDDDDNEEEEEEDDENNFFMDEDEADDSDNDSESAEGMESEDDEQQGESLRDIMQQMDTELKSTNIAKTFADQERGEISGPDSDDEDDEDSAAFLKPVDVDVNLVKSLLASYSEQQGLAGPASTLLAQLGKELPDNADDRPRS